MFQKRLCQKFVFCLEKSLNNVTTKEQLDMHIILFDENAKEINRKYIGSEFIRHKDEETDVKAFKSLHRKLDYVY